jgi:hypothetical protein
VSRKSTELWYHCLQSFGLDLGASLDTLPTCIRRSYISKHLLATLPHTHRYQLVRTRKYYPRKRQEARLYLPCIAATLLPIGMFIYAWTATPEVPWIVPAIGLTVGITYLSLIETDDSQGIHVWCICNLHGGLLISRRLVNII